MSDKIREALEGMLAIHDEPSGFAGKYGRALDEAIAAQKAKIDQRIAAARTALAQQPAPVAVPEDCPHMIVFDDTDREPLIFAGAGAREAASKTWAQISNSWNAHLFVRIGSNSRDDRYPSAMLAASPAAPVAVGQEPVAWQQRYIDPDEGPSIWQNTDDRTAALLRGRSDYELRPLYSAPPAAHAAPAAPVAVGQEPVAWTVSVVWSGRRMPLGTHVVWWADETYRIEPSPESQDWPKVMQVSAEVYAKHHAAFLNSLDPSNAAVAVPLYTAQPAAEQPDAVKVPRELLRRVLSGEECGDAADKLRALLGKDGEA